MSETETRMICCPNCGGDGGWDGEFSPLHYGHWTTCTYCGGTGNIEVDAEPITACPSLTTPSEQ